METYKEQMQGDMVLRGLAPKTQSLYHRAARDMERHFKKPPDLLEDGDVKAYLLYIVRDKKVSQSTLKITYSALRSYGDRMGSDLKIELLTLVGRFAIL